MLPVPFLYSGENALKPKVTRGCNYQIPVQKLLGTGIKIRRKLAAYGRSQWKVQLFLSTFETQFIVKFCFPIFESLLTQRLHAIAYKVWVWIGYFNGGNVKDFALGLRPVVLLNFTGDSQLKCNSFSWNTHYQLAWPGSPGPNSSCWTGSWSRFQLLGQIRSGSLEKGHRTYLEEFSKRPAGNVKS